MRLLLIANDETTIYNFRREILRAFHAMGYEVILCLPQGAHTKEIEACGCRVVNIEVHRHGTNPLQDLKFMKTCLEQIRANRPDMVLTYTVKPNIYGSFAARLKGVPYINNITGLGAVLQSDSPLARLMLALQKIAFRKSYCIFFQNESNYITLLDKGIVRAETPAEILPGSGVNLDLHSFVPMRPDDGTVRFVIVSRIRADKGYNEFFDAAEAVKGKYANTEFHVVGWYEDDFYRKRIDHLVREGVIVYHGLKVQEKVHRIVASCDCSVLPSYHEGMANALLEAASTGRPVIASRIPGCREAFEEGITGYGCDVKSASSLRDAMEKMVLTAYEERVKMGVLGRRKMEREFDRSFVADRYIRRIEKFAEGKHNGSV